MTEEEMTKISIWKASTIDSPFLCEKRILVTIKMSEIEMHAAGFHVVSSTDLCFGSLD